MNAFFGSSNKKVLTYGALALFIGGALALFVLPFLNGAPAAELSGDDAVTEWTWKGPYKDGGALEEQTEREIADLKSELGKKTYPDYQLLVGIAGQYELLGDGKNAYAYLEKAIQEDPKQGLAYINLGHLMESLGAYDTAKEAYDTAVKLEPSNQAYAQARAQFLAKRFPNQ